MPASALVYSVGLDARMENRVFFPQAALDEWIVDGTVELQDGELTHPVRGPALRLAEAVRVVREVSGAGDGTSSSGG